MIRVLIADDEALVRGGLRLILSAQPDLEVVADAADGEEAVQLANRLAPDVVLMDIHMTPTDGIAATERILAARSATRVIMLTTFDLDEYVYRALRAGASGFMLKTTPPRELAEAVRTAARGDALLSPSITRRLIDHYTATASVAGHPSLAELTARETEVLRMMALGLSNREIAGQLFVGEATVKTHVNRIFAKLGVRDRVQAVVLAYQSGVAQLRR
ncbi:DNA-binding response regulator, NarL/FixJ family, contains REC and HTH domains [Micromonospora viridifaciens]|uniref:DNA-binding response regulator, NarL/FixJ family, contains REC and HTH domains n=1 Tax=Micromonospora viridifaciens TaxID=1881 RepID=A0A1C4VQH7_MICVI|nr:response regulator transcription factor [Micromonospora viridifaciens]SCE86198.1 DNA-binding response regulator, NarL/FixJ family, contains REC and HTH domains [Micromonospora viridifaciens]